MPAYKAKTFPLLPGPAWIRDLMQSCVFILAMNWCFQGMRGMDAKELAFRLGAELLLAASSALLLLALGLAAVPALALGLFLAHSAGFTLNGQVWVCARYCRCYRGDAAQLARYLDELRTRLVALPWLEEAVLIGSQARRPPGPRSDIDLRLIVPTGAQGWLRANLLLLALRAAAFRRGLPLDLYAYDRPASLRRFNQDEPLELILDRRGRLAAMFASRIAA